MSANMRATPPPSSSGRHGSTANVLASGIAIMTDSSIALKPVIEEPSKPMPPSNASSSSAALMLNDFSWPRMSVNQSRMKRMPRASVSALTSSGVLGGAMVRGSLVERWSGGTGPAVQALAGQVSRRRSGEPAVRPGLQPARSSEPAVRPGLQPAQRRGELAPHFGQYVLDAARGVGLDAALDDAARLQLLHALGQQPVGELRDRLGDLGEAHRVAFQEDDDDRARPALADQLDGFVEVRAAPRLAGRVERRDGSTTARGRAHRRESLRRAQDARVLDRAVDGDLAGDVDHRDQRLERHVRDRLEQLLVGPAGLARLLVQVHRREAALLD